MRRNGWIRLPTRLPISIASFWPRGATARVRGKVQEISFADNSEEGEGESLVDRRPRPAVTSTNVKALFDGPGPYPSTVDPASMGFAGPLSYHNPQRVSDYWQPAGPPAPTPLINPNANSEIETNKRDSDPITQEKVRQASHGHNHPPTNPLSHAARNVSARTQSLDISTMNFSRTLSGSAGVSPFGPMPPSPGAVAASPNTASGQYFPGQHLRANNTGRAGLGSYDSAVDNVTQGEWGIANYLLMFPGLSNVQVSHQ